MPKEQPQSAQADTATAEQTTSCGRRTFLYAGIGVFGAGYAGAVGYPVFRFLNTPAERAASASAVTQVTLSENADKLEPGSAKAFLFGPKPALLIRAVDGTWAAFEAVCTHLGCTVKYEADKDRIFCPCHSGVYDAKTGAPVAGPPPKGLKKFSVEVKDGEVVVSLG